MNELKSSFSIKRGGREPQWRKSAQFCAGSIFRRAHRQLSVHLLKQLELIICMRRLGAERQVGLGTRPCATSLCAAG